MVKNLKCPLTMLRTAVMAGFMVTTLVGTGSFGQAPNRGGQSGRSGVESSFTQRSPGIGQPVPEVKLYTADGKEFSTSQLKGSYTVLVFGCLT